MNGLPTEPSKRWMRKKWIRYEREILQLAMAYGLDHHRGEGVDDRLVAYLDDASRFVVGCGLIHDATSRR